jgi:hypothetical protein
MLTRDEVTTTLKQQLHERFAPDFPGDPEALKQKLWDVMWVFCSEDPPDCPELNPPDCPELSHDNPAKVAYTHLATALIEYFKHDNENEQLLAESCDNLLFLANAVLIEVFDKRMPREHMEEFDRLIPA